MDIELKNVDSSCLHFDEKSRTYSSTPGPEVSVNLVDPLALKKGKERTKKQRRKRAKCLDKARALDD